MLHTLMSPAEALPNPNATWPGTICPATLVRHCSFKAIILGVLQERKFSAEPAGEIIALHSAALKTKLRGADGADIAAGTGTDDDDVEEGVGHALVLSHGL